MTLSAYYKPTIAIGNGSTTRFSFNFDPISIDYLRVSFLIDGEFVEQPTGWRVLSNGREIVFDEAPTTIIAIERYIEESQEVSYTTSSGFDAKVVEHSFDKVTALVQQLSEELARCVKVDLADNRTPDEILDSFLKLWASQGDISYDYTYSYHKGDVVRWSKRFFISKVNDNLHHYPQYQDPDDEYWLLLSVAKTYDDTEIDEKLSHKANASEVYTRTQVDSFLSAKADKANIYTKDEVDEALNEKADKTTTYTKNEVDTKIAVKANASDVYVKSETNSLLDGKQNKLTAGANITIENNVISASGGLAEVNWGGITGDIAAQLDLQNALDSKQDILESGENIKTINGEDILGSGNIEIGGSSIIDRTFVANKTVYAENWLNTSSYEEYPYSYNIFNRITNITPEEAAKFNYSNTTGMVAFNLADAISGNFAPVAEIGSYYDSDSQRISLTCTIFAKEVPTDNIRVTITHFLKGNFNG